MFKSLVNWLLGRGRVKMGITVREVQGNPQPMVALKFTEHWFDWKIYLIDPVSFLLIAEKLEEWVKNNGIDKAFVYERVHNTTLIKLTIPPYAMKEVALGIAATAPVVYDTISKVDEVAKQYINSMRDKVPPEAIKQMEIMMQQSMLSSYRAEHAKMHGYTVTVEGTDAIN